MFCKRWLWCVRRRPTHPRPPSCSSSTPRPAQRVRRGRGHIRRPTPMRNRQPGSRRCRVKRNLYRRACHLARPGPGSQSLSSIFTAPVRLPESIVRKPLRKARSGRGAELSDIACKVRYPLRWSANLDQMPCAVARSTPSEYRAAQDGEFSGAAAAGTASPFAARHLADSDRKSSGRLCPRLPAAGPSCMVTSPAPANR